MKKVVVILLAIFMIVLCSCSQKNEEVTPAYILKTLNIGMSVDAEAASNIKYSIIENEVGKIEFEYQGAHFEYYASMKRNFNQMEPTNIEKNLSSYIIKKDSFEYTINATKLIEKDSYDGMICEWIAETSMGTYKCFYLLYSPDFMINEESLAVLVTIVSNVIFM